MDKEGLWKRFQTNMGYTDAEMAVFRSDPLKVKMVTESPVNQIYERFIAHSDPNNERTAVVQCSDVRLDKGGWGKILMKVSVERVK